MTHIRPRRLRGHDNLRRLIQDVSLDKRKFVFPLFIKHGVNLKHPIASMPGHFQFSIDNLEEELSSLQSLGITNLLLFGIPNEKDAMGGEACAEDGIIPRAIRRIKSYAPDMLVISDVCLCEYTDHGHCGILSKTNNDVDNDESLKHLAKQAVAHAKAGADVVAPSACMDGMVRAIRDALDTNGFKNVPILSYAVKYASSLYGPFRMAAEGAPKFGDRRGYQMDYANTHEALRECALDTAEGADMLMVKPAHTYLDILCRVKAAHPELPLAAYHTSGEFAMLKAAAEKGFLDERKSVTEVLTAIHRAGADFIITYYAKEWASWMSDTP